MQLPEWFMDRYRGTRGLFGWVVLRADIRWLKNIVEATKRTADTVSPFADEELQRAALRYYTQTIRPHVEAFHDRALDETNR